MQPICLVPGVLSFYSFLKKKKKERKIVWYSEERVNQEVCLYSELSLTFISLQISVSSLSSGDDALVVYQLRKGFHVFESACDGIGRHRFSSDESSIAIQIILGQLKIAKLCHPEY